METIIRRAADEREWVVFSEDPVVVRRLESLFGPGEKRSDIGRVWRLPLKGVSFRRPRKTQGCDEQKRKELAERLAKARKSRG
jgi:hypothetical protein